MWAVRVFYSSKCDSRILNAGCQSDSPLLWDWQPQSACINVMGFTASNSVYKCCWDAHDSPIGNNLSKWWLWCIWQEHICQSDDFDAFDKNISVKVMILMHLTRTYRSKWWLWCIWQKNKSVKVMTWWIWQGHICQREDFVDAYDNTIWNNMSQWSRRVYYRAGNASSQHCDNATTRQCDNATTSLWQANKRKIVSRLCQKEVVIDSDKATNNNLLT